MGIYIVAGVLMIVVVAAAATSLRMIPENERIVVYTLGRYTGVKGPGLVLVLPIVQIISRVDMRERKLTVTESFPAPDNRPGSITATILYRVTAPDKAANNVEDYASAMEAAAKAALKEACAGGDIGGRIDRVAASAKEALSQKAAGWGITLSSLDVRYPG